MITTQIRKYGTSKVVNIGNNFEEKETVIVMSLNEFKNLLKGEEN